jgi:Domain of unknown function (DUF5134)
MIVLASLRWILSTIFVLTSGFHLTRCLRPRRLPGPVTENWVSEALHLIMGISMIVMIWPVGEWVPVPVWAAVFTASTGWFAARTFWSAGRRPAPIFFASSMAAMVWMGVSMPAQASSGDRSGMVMDGMTMSSGPVGVAGWISGLLGGYLVVVAFWWFARGLRLGPAPAVAGGRPQPLSWSSLCHGLMSIGMGLALLAMA